MKNILIVFLFLAGLILPGCENNELLLSEKKLKSELQGTWKIVSPRPVDGFLETWNLNGGAIAVSSVDENRNITASGAYSVDAKFSKAYVTLSGFTYSNFLCSGFKAEDLNRRWTLVELNDGVLYLSATDSNGAIRSIEFIKQ
jgi:hypothetical protein